MTLKVALTNLGCRVNRVELDMMANQLEAAGAELVGEKDAACVVINTCGVTGEAEAKSRKAVRHAAALPNKPLVIATGCVASLFSAELEALADNVCVLSDKRAVAGHILDAFEGECSPGEGEATGATAVTAGVTPTGRTRPGIQVQDGCDNRCTYCIIWKARGRARSFDPQGIVDEVNASIERGAHEVVLTGINLGDYRWERDGADPMRLPQLLDLVLSKTSIERVRLSSIEPPDVTAELVSLMAASDGRVAPFLHICLQSGCDETLRRMARVYRTDLFRQNVQLARELLPNVALGTDLIVGFPGETDEQFAESLAFCQEMRFAKMHIFRYSKRPGTPAASFADQVAPEVMAARSKQAHALAAQMRLAEAKKLVGATDLALVQYPGRAVSGGLFDVAVDPSYALDSLVPVRFDSVRDDATLVGVAP